jgi:hypothetical protein
MITRMNRQAQNINNQRENLFLHASTLHNSSTENISTVLNWADKCKACDVCNRTVEGHEQVSTVDYRKALIQLFEINYGISRRS